MLGRIGFFSMVLCVGALTLAAPAWMLAAMVQGTNKIEFKEGKATIDGSLANDDAKDRARKHPGKLFTVPMKAGHQYQIDLISKEFDSFLRLEDAGGKQLAEDDDGGGYPNARITFNCLANGNYAISATTYNGGTGKFTLLVTETAAKLSKALTLKNGGLTETGKLDNTDGKDSVRRDSLAKVYTVNLDAGEKYTIDMISTDFDSYLRLEDANGKQLAADDDSGGNLNARIDFTSPAEGTYRIICTSFRANAGGNFTLLVKKQ